MELTLGLFNDRVNLWGFSDSPSFIDPPPKQEDRQDTLGNIKVLLSTLGAIKGASESTSPGLTCVLICKYFYISNQYIILSAFKQHLNFIPHYWLLTYPA